MEDIIGYKGNMTNFKTIYSRMNLKLRFKPKRYRVKQGGPVIRNFFEILKRPEY